jgi:hypothetical protein
MEKAIKTLREFFTILLWLSIAISWYFGNLDRAILSGIILVILELEKVNARGPRYRHILDRFGV